MKNAIILTNNIHLLGRNKFSNLHFDLFGDKVEEKSTASDNHIRP